MPQLLHSFGEMYSTCSEMSHSNFQFYLASYWWYISFGKRTLRRSTALDDFRFPSPFKFWVFGLTLENMSV